MPLTNITATNLNKIAGTSLTGRDWSSDFANLDIAFSSLRDALKPVRTAPIQVLSAKSIAANSTENIDESGLDGYSAIILIVKATYDASATAGVRVRWLYSPNGSNFDSTEDAEDAGDYEDMTFSAGATRQRTFLVPVFTDDLRVQIVNQDASKAVTVDAWKILLH